MERKGIETSRGDDLREARAENRVRVMFREMEPQAVLSAVERMAEEERADRQAAIRENERDLRRGTALPSYARDLLSAVRRLFQTLGVSLGNVITIDPGDLRGQGRLMKTEAYELRRQEAEREGVALGLAPRVNAPEKEPAAKRETLLEKLKREAAERGDELAVQLRPQPARRVERTLGMRPRRRPGEPDEPD